MKVLTFMFDHVVPSGCWSIARCRTACTRPVLALSLLLVLVGTGCSDDPGPTLVTIRTGEPPALVAFRDEASTAWQTLPTAGTSTFEIIATGPYRVVVACESVGDQAFLGMTQYARTPADGPLIEHTCSSRDYPFVASGQMVQPGEVSLGYIGQGTTASNWSFEIPSVAGSFDLVMLFGDFTIGFDRIAIRRGIQIAGDTQLGSIDLAKENTQALVPTPFTAANLQPGESLSSSTLLFSGSTVALLQNSFLQSQPGWNTKRAPDSMLRATDRQNIQLSATEMSSGTSLQSRYRSVRRDVHVGDPSSVTLPEPLGPVTFEMTTDRLAATWSTLPEHDELSLWRESYSADFSWIFHELTLSRAFIDATGATSTTLDFSDIPGFKSEWRQDPTLNQWRGFSASRGASFYDSVSSAVSEPIYMMPPTHAWTVNNSARGASAAEAMAPSLTGTPRTRAIITRHLGTIDPELAMRF